MLKKLSYFFFLLFSITTSAQHITGKVYDSKSVLKNIKISNITKQSVVYSDDEGIFKIKAELNDSLVFSSIFYKEQRLQITQYHLDELFVVELEKTTNSLDEIAIKSNPKAKEFSEEKYQANFGEQLKNDMKNNPHLYGPPSSGNMDFVKIIGLIGKLFKKKNKEDAIIYATYTDFKNTFEKSSFFNNKLLTDDLKIEADYKFLFFEFCETKQINLELLNKQHQVELLDLLFKASEEFLAFIERYKQNQKIEDSKN